MSLDSSLQRIWYGRPSHGLSLLLLPLSWLFGAVTALRRAMYRAGLLRTVRVTRPVIVVGNLTVGGTGKTPFTMWLADALQRRRVRVGIVLRGYGGSSPHWPREVTAETPWREVGDEAALLYARTRAIVVAGPDRVAAARLAIERGADVVLSDDGLQHYRLGRDCEIALVDAERSLGNGRLLPAGPLREPARRLRRVDFVVATRRSPAAPTLPADRFGSRGALVHAESRLGAAVALVGGETRDLASFRGQRVHALAGIGNPAAFFSALAEAGIEVVPHPLPDHAVLDRASLEFGDALPVLMTEKDAVRCRDLADRRYGSDRYWAVRLDVEMRPPDADGLLTRIAQLIPVN